MTTLDDVIGIFQTAGAAIDGVKSAPNYPPEKAGDFPFFVSYPALGKSEQKPQGSMTTLYDIMTEFHIAKQGTLSAEVEFLLAYPEVIMEALFKACNDNLLAQAGIEFSFRELNWEDTDTLGFAFTTRAVKIITDFS